MKNHVRPGFNVYETSMLATVRRPNKVTAFI
jgi:hypothetical protein